MEAYPVSVEVDDYICVLIEQSFHGGVRGYVH